MGSCASIIPCDCFDLLDAVEMFQHIMAFSDFGKDGYLSAVLEPRELLLHVFENVVGLCV